MFKQIIHYGYSFFVITDTAALLWYRASRCDGMNENNGIGG